MTNGLLPDGELAISLSELVRAIERRPPLNERTLQSWIEIGVDGQAGRRVYLQAEKQGKLWFTSVEAYHRFRAACNGQ